MEEVQLECLELECTFGEGITWSAVETSESNFAEAYSVISKARFVHSGVSALSAGFPEGERVLHWEVSGGVVCFKEYWLCHTLLDNALCVRLGDEATGFPVAVFFDDVSASRGAPLVKACFLMPDGQLHIINLEARSKEESVLAHLVHQRQGRLVDFVVDDELRGRHYSSYKFQQIPETCSIKCGTWQSSGALAIGLTQGGILTAQTRGAGRWDEQFLRDAGSKSYVGSISHWWSAGSNNASGGSSLERPDVAAMAACSSGIFSVDSNGMVAFWGRTAAQINAMDAWPDLKPENVGHLDAKICVLENLDDGCILVAVAIDLVTLGKPDKKWRIAFFNFRPQGSFEVLGVLDVLDEAHNADDSTKSLLVDMQFSPESSMDGRRCLNSLWRSLDKNHGSERETSITTELYTTTFEPSRPPHGLHSDSSVVKSNGVDNRMDKWRMDLEMKDHFNPTAFDSLMALYTTMMQRIFLPGRFPTRIILEVLMHDVPFELQLLPDTAPSVDELADIAEHVLRVCQRWAETEAVRAANLESASFLAFFCFIELCQKRATAEDDFGDNCLLATRHVASDAGSKIRCFIASRGRLSLVTAPTEWYNPVVASPDVRFSSFLDKALHHWEEMENVRAIMRETILGHIQDFPASAYAEIVDKLSEVLLNHVDNKTAQVTGELKFLVDATPPEVTAMLDILYPRDFDPESDTSFTKFGHENPSAANPQELVSAVSRMAVAKMYEHYEKKSIALAIVLSVLSGAGRQFDEARVTVLKSLKHLLYYGFLLWLDKVHPTDATDLRRSMDLGHVLPNSCVLSKHGQKNSNGSVLGNFWISGERTLDCLNLDKRSPIDWIKSCACQCVHVLRPSPVGDLATYLLRHEQYSCLARLASLLELVLDPHARQMGDDFTSFSNDMLKSRTLALQSSADFYECLRRHAQMRGSEMAQTDKVALLQNVDAILASAPVELDYPMHADSLISSEGDRHGMEMEENEDQERNGRALDDVGALDDFFEGEWHHQIDAASCVHDPLKKMLQEDSSPFSNLVDLVGGKFSRQFLSHALVQNLCRLNYLIDSLDIFRRARSVLPVDVGAEVCKRTGEILLPTLNSLLEFCNSQVEMRELRACLENDFMTTKNRVFNAALENFSFDEAWKAVEHMLELQRVKRHCGDMVQDDRKAVPQWQVCLRSLVSLACDSGHLDWLCDQNENAGVDGQNAKSFLADQVFKELDRLSRSSGIASSGQVNYFECLFTFLFRRGNYSDAAKSLLALAFREENVNATLRSRSLAAAICTLSTPHVEATHQYLVVPSSSLSSSSSWSAHSEHEIFFSRQKLALHFLLELAKAEIASIDPSYPVCPVSASLSLMHDCKRCVRDLSDVCRATDRVHLAFLAVSVAVQAELVARGGQDMGDMRVHYNPTSGAFVALEMAVAVLTDLCAVECSRVWNTAAASLSFYVPAADASDAELLIVLMDVLATLDCGFPNGNWALQHVAIEHVLDNYSGNKQLLEALLVSYLGAAFSSETKTAKVFHDCHGNPTALLKLLMSRGHLEEACDYAVKLLQRLSYAKPGRVWLPYALFDELMSCCDAHDSRAGVSDAKRALVAALTTHFEHLLVS